MSSESQPFIFTHKTSNTSLIQNYVSLASRATDQQNQSQSINQSIINHTNKTLALPFLCVTRNIHYPNNAYLIMNNYLNSIF